MPIPATELVNSIPGVLTASGSAVSLAALCLTNSWRVPTGTVQGFPDQPSVAAFFGDSSAEAADAQVYFEGFDGRTATAAQLLFVQYPTAPLGVTPYLRGASVASMTLAQLQAVASGTLGITVNGVSVTSSTIDLSAVSSFSAAAAAIQTALNYNDASFTAAIAPATFSATGSISDDVMTVTNVGSGSVAPGATISGTGVVSGTQVLDQLTGTPGAAGTYRLSESQTVASGSISGAYGVLTVSAVASGTIAVGQAVAGASVAAGTVIWGEGTGTGGGGTYNVSVSQTVASEAMTSGALAVAYDSVSGAFVVNGGTPGTPGTIGEASGTVATALKLTTATGATLSQGAPMGDPTTNMNAVLTQVTNWGSFFSAWEPNTSDKVAFATWVNAQNKRYAYSMADTDPTVGAGTSAQSAGAQIKAANLSGVIATWSPSASHKGAMVAGFLACIDFTRENGRTTLAYRTQSGMAPDVTDATTRANCKANGYNTYGAYSDIDSFNLYQDGSISGPFTWADTFANQIWLNGSLRSTMLKYLMSIGAAAYTLAGYTGIETAMLAPIQAAKSFGAIVAGVTLSAAQIQAAKDKAGLDISGPLQTQGYYLQVLDPGADVRAARGSPIINFFYCDGGAVQSLNIPSEVVQ